MFLRFEKITQVLSKTISRILCEKNIYRTFAFQILKLANTFEIAFWFWSVVLESLVLLTSSIIFALFLGNSFTHVYFYLKKFSKRSTICGFQRRTESQTLLKFRWSVYVELFIFTGCVLFCWYKSFIYHFVFCRVEWRLKEFSIAFWSGYNVGLSFCNILLANDNLLLVHDKEPRPFRRLRKTNHELWTCLP